MKRILTKKNCGNLFLEFTAQTKKLTRQLKEASFQTDTSSGSLEETDTHKHTLWSQCLCMFEGHWDQAAQGE